MILGEEVCIITCLIFKLGTEALWSTDVTLKVRTETGECEPKVGNANHSKDSNVCE